VRLDQRQRRVLLVPHVGGEARGQLPDRLGQSGLVIGGEGRVDRVEGRIKAGVLGLHRLEDHERFRRRDRVAQLWPERDVLGPVVDLQLGLEPRPGRGGVRCPGTPGRTGIREPAQVAGERVVRGVHDREVDLPRENDPILPDRCALRRGHDSAARSID